MEPQAPKPKRISGDTKRKRDIEICTTQVSLCCDLFEATKRSYMHSQSEVARAKQALEMASRKLKFEQNRLHEKTTQYCREMTKLERTKTSLNNLLAIDDLKTVVKTQKKEQSIQKQHDKRGGKKFTISDLEKLPFDVVLYIGEFLTHPVMTKYLEDVYNPFPTFNKLRVDVKRSFIQLAIRNNKYFSHYTAAEISAIERKFNRAGHKTINDEIAILIHKTKLENPEGMHKLVKAMCILFKRKTKYTANWNTFWAERTRLLALGN